MKSRIKFFLALIIGASFFCDAKSEDAALTGAELGKWTQDYDAALKLAAEKDVPILLNFTGSDWCHWCIIMDKNVFAGDDWKKYASENAVLVTLDFPKDKTKVPENFQARNAQLQQTFGVRGYPSYIILDSDGKSFLGKLGAGKEKTPKSFVEEFKQTTWLSAANIKVFEAANPDKVEAFKKARADVEKIESEFEAWATTKPEQNEANNKVFEGFKARMAESMKALQSFRS